MLAGTFFSDDADTPVPDRLSEGIRLEHVSFAYPGTEKRALDDIDLKSAVIQS